MLRKKNIEFTEADRENFLVIFSRLLSILCEANLPSQAEVVRKLEILSRDKKNMEFVEQLNSIDMWGGSGAVWEVHIKDDRNAREFETEMIKLINLMERANVLGRGVKPIRKLFHRLINDRK